MINTIFNFLVAHISAYGAVFIVSMIPLIELRGSVIVGTAFGLPCSTCCCSALSAI